MSSTTVKAIYTSRYEIELCQDEEGRYRVRYMVNNENNYSEWTIDFGQASYMFAIKWQDLEGN